MRRCSLLVTAIVLSSPSMAQEPPTHGARQGVISLANGDQFSGEVRPSRQNELSWQANNFADPFLFRTGDVSAIRFPALGSADPVEGPFSIELANGDVVYGDIVSISAESVELRSKELGNLTLRTNMLRRIYRIDKNAAVTFSSLRGLSGWRVPEPATGMWSDDGEQIFTNRAGAWITADLGMPSRAVIDLELSYQGRPDFVVAAAVDAASDVDSQHDGWRLETAGDALAIARQENDRADVCEVADLSRGSRVRLIAYLDQTAGTLEVLSGEGISKGRIEIVPSSVPTDESGERDVMFPTGIRIINRGSGLRVERLQVSRWVGGIPSRNESGRVSISSFDRGMINGVLIGLDESGTQLRLDDSSAQGIVPIDKVSEIRFAAAPKEISPSQCGVFVRGGLRLSGDLMEVTESDWVLGGDQYVGPVKLPHAMVRTLVVFRGEPANSAIAPGRGRAGKIEIGDDHSAGRLVSTDNAAEQAEDATLPMSWHPALSQRSARLLESIDARIVYRESARVDRAGAAAKMLEQQRLRTRKQKRGLNFGELFLQRTNLSKANPVKRDAHVIHLRSGDVIACRVDAIDDEGVHLSTATAPRGFVPHAMLKAVEFGSNSIPPNIDDAKRDRLLTIPRLQKSLPPTHLLCSHNGDFLRCRVLGTNGGAFLVEVQSRKLSVPRERVSQMIWFHPDEYQADEFKKVSDLPGQGMGAVDYSGLIQVVLGDSKRMTFTPTGFHDGAIEGHSEWVGDVRFDVGSIHQIVLGNRIATEVADFAYNKWRMQAAVEPLVTAAMKSGGSAGTGRDSPMVGQPAPDVKLQLLDGELFRVSDCKGQIVVLDFWASWCAPCIQTMPILSEAIAEFDQASVKLVSVNLEEPASLVADVLRRHKIESSVALDIDGIAAQRYQATAIPQLVVIGADGLVKRLYVGGGAAVVNKLRSDLQELLGITTDTDSAP